MSFFDRFGALIVISSPSGAGKTTICKKLISEDKNLYLSVSVTTRKKRKKETEGIDYFFYSKNDFLKLQKQGKFLETAQVFDNLYGTLKEEVNDKLKKGIDVIIDIDWQGTRQIDSYMDGNLVKIFLLPPSLEDLNKRLSSRGTESSEEIELRLSKAVKEIEHFDEYDYILINDDLKSTYENIRSIINAERMRISRQKNLKNFIDILTK